MRCNAALKKKSGKCESVYVVHIQSSVKQTVLQSHIYHKLVMKKTGFSATAALLCSSSIFLCTLLDSTCALYCWENSCDGADNWRLQKCNTTNNEISCLAQYRLHNGAQKPSYFGCHTTDTPCGRSCDVEEGQRNDFSCCCSGDLCNEVAGMGSESGM